MHSLKEGKEYKFLVEKQVCLPDNSFQFVVKGPDSRKYLIPCERYSHYGITEGTQIICRIDRINCRGEVFLEPRNPWYKEGKSYAFTVFDTEMRTDSNGFNREVLIVLDINGDKISVLHDTSQPLPEKGTKIDLVVEKVRKGKVYLAQSSNPQDKMFLRTGKNYEFTIIRIEKGVDDEDYFVIQDQFGYLNTIPKQYYEYYGFSVGTKFRGKIVKYRSNLEKTIEPENPFYKIGQLLELEVTGYNKSFINDTFTIDLRDKFGITHCISSKSQPVKSSVTCRVKMIRKGKPLLSLV